MNKCIADIPRVLKNQPNFPFWYSMIYEASYLINLNNIQNVVDFGSGKGGFLQLYNLLYSCNDLLGVEQQSKLLDLCNKENTSKNISYIHYNNFKDLKAETKELVFSQEVVYTMQNIDTHAQEVFNILKKGGYYIFTIGCHIDNKTWNNRKERISLEEDYNAYTYSSTDVARAFYEAGFRVSVKRLPVHYPLTFDFSSQNEFSSVSELLMSSEESKLLFILLKPKYLN